MIPDSNNRAPSSVSPPSPESLETKLESSPGKNKANVEAVSRRAEDDFRLFNEKGYVLACAADDLFTEKIRNDVKLSTLASLNENSTRAMRWSSLGFAVSSVANVITWKEERDQPAKRQAEDILKLYGRGQQEIYEDPAIPKRGLALLEMVMSVPETPFTLEFLARALGVGYHASIVTKVNRDLVSALNADWDFYLSQVKRQVWIKH